MKSFYSRTTKRWIFLLKMELSLTNHCKVKGKISNGIKAWLFSEKGEYSCVFVEKILPACFFRVVVNIDTPFDLTRVNCKVVVF